MNTNVAAVEKPKRKLPPGEFRIQVRIWAQWAFLAIATGPLFILAPVIKQIPAPWYICWSDPLAIAACPLGTIQHFTGSGHFTYFTIGLLGLIGVLIGRMTCGWSCPMGFLQEMIYKSKRYGNYIVGGIIFVTTLFLAWFTPFMAMLQSKTGSDAGLKFLLDSGDMNGFVMWSAIYLVVAVFLSIWFFLPVKKYSLPNNFSTFARWFFFIVPFIIFPYITRFDALGNPTLLGEVWWCKICPIGTITAGFPQMYLQLVPQGAFPIFGLTSTAFIGISTYQGIFGEARIMYFIKWVLTSGLVFMMVGTKRPFCKAICPLGTMFTITNWFSAAKIKVDQANCRGSSCNWCLKHCPMDIAIYDPTSQWHCIRCLDCLGCPFGVVKHELPGWMAWMVRKEDKKVMPLKTPNPPNNPNFFEWAGILNYVPPQARK